MRQGVSSLQASQIAQAIFQPFDLDDIRQRLGQLGMGPQAGWGSTSKEFLDLVKAIGEAKSKAEEDRIVTGEIETLKKRICEPDVPRKKMKEYLVRLVYVEMLGHSASFGYIHAVKMTHDQNLMCKKVGYLAVTLFLEENHDLIILIVNTIRNDLKSDNHLVVCAALTTVCKLINAETIPAVLPQVIDLFSHPKEVVRKKAVMALHRFHQRSPSNVSHVIQKFRQALCDKDPSVMSASLCALYDLAVSNPPASKSLTSSFVSILKQVAEHRLPKQYDYRRVPAPFIQIKLLKILAILGANDKSASQSMYGVLGDVLKKASASTNNIGNAILYECICTVTSIYPEMKLLEQCVDVTSRLLKDDNHNLKYLGIDALGRVYKINPDFVTMEKFAVIDCLEDQDETLKRKTLDLLYRMTNQSNVEVIVERMIGYMRALTDVHGKTEIAARVIELVEQFAPSNHWFIQTMNTVFELAGDLVRPSVAHNLMRLIAEGSGNDDEDADSLLRSSAVESYLQLLKEPKLPSILLQVICWVLGEYGTADGMHTLDEIVGNLCDVAESQAHDDAVRGYALTAITKLVAFESAAGQPVNLIPEARSFMEDMLRSQSTDLQQRAYELQSLLAVNGNVLTKILPMDSSCKEVEVDLSLSFLDGFVTQAIERGAEPYVPEGERLRRGGLSSALVVVRGDASDAHQQTSLRFEAYDKPAPPSSHMGGSSSGSSGPLLLMGGPSAAGNVPGNGQVERGHAHRGSWGGEGSSRGGFAGDMEDARDYEGSVKLNLGSVQRKWGRPTPQTSSTLVSSSSLPSMPMGFDHSTSSNGAAVGGDSYGSSRQPDVRSYGSGGDRGKKEPAVSAEKQRLAASLFGGGAKTDAVGGGRVGAGRRGSASKAQQSKPSSAAASPARTPTSTKAAPPTAPLDASPPPPPPLQKQPSMDLLDMSDLDGTTTSTPSVSSDPFKQLESLVLTSDSLSQPVQQTKPNVSTSAPSSSSPFDLLSLYQGLPSSTASGPPSSSSSGGYGGGVVDLAGLMMGTPSTGLRPGVATSGETSGAGTRKTSMNSQQLGQQKMVNAKKAGVTPSGANPSLFKDIFG